MKHVLPPTIFFFVGFNLIVWTKRLILEEQGIEFSGFFTATAVALLAGKAVLVTDNLPFMRRFDGAPMIQPILFKSAIYWLCVLIVRLAEGLVHFLAAGGVIADFPLRRSVGQLLSGRIVKCRELYRRSAVAILEHLCSPNRERNQIGERNTSDWSQACGL